MRSKLPGTILLLCMLIQGCDLWHKRKCEWYIMPEPKHKELVEQGWASVCLANYELGRQKCFFKMPLKDAEAVYGKKVRYSDLEVDEDEFPRTIKSYKVCGL